MTYFTSWDINLSLCLLKVGLPYDLVTDWCQKFAKVQRELIMEEAREYYLDRKEYLPTTGKEKEKKLVRDRQAHRAYGYGKEINMKAISPIKTICNNFWLLIQKVNWEYQKKLEEIEPEDRYEYFAWAFTNYYDTNEGRSNVEWSVEKNEWIKMFHPGRFFLMDLKRGVRLETIRSWLYFGAIKEGRFIIKKHHIDDIFLNN